MDRTVFTFDPEDVKSMSTDVLDKALGTQLRPISSTELALQKHLAGREWHYSAPSGEGKRNRFSMGSLEYLSDGAGG